MVDRWGKWIEEDFSSVYYPPFACGSGNLLSHSLAKWLSNNSPYLFHYQGEDVSLGIWLSAINPSLVDNNLWVCNEKCIPAMIVSAQNNITHMNMLWENRETCGNPCNC